MSISSNEKRSSKASSRSLSQRESVQEQQEDELPKQESVVSESLGNYSFIRQAEEFVKPTLQDYQLQELQGKELFPEVLTSDVHDDEEPDSKQRKSILETGFGLINLGSFQDALKEHKETSKDRSSILVTGFGMRNLRSLQDALEQDEQKRLLELYKYQELEMQREQMFKVDEGKVESRTTLISLSKKSSAGTETMPIPKADFAKQKFPLEYLLGLEADTAEEGTGFEKLAVSEAGEEDKFEFSTSTSMKAAQKYLRVHRIFDFFQFITAHLLGAIPENPIAFILELLNKCLLYRSGLGKPPLLYEKKHVEQLFSLMDRMGSGFIELDQYHKGMNTLGICEYNKNPTQTQDGMVSKEDFINEVLDAETALFDDLIKRKWIGKKSRPKPEPEPFDIPSLSRDLSGSYLFPSDLFRSLKSGKSGKDDFFQGLGEFCE